MAERKYNHYVPKFYLANFSGNKRFIDKCILSSGKIIRSASIKTTAGQDYLYGEDGIIEEAFCQLEGYWDGVIKRIIQTEQIPINGEDYERLLHFFILSENRTLARANNNLEAWSDLYKMIAKLLKENGEIVLSDETISAISANSPIPNLQDLKNDMLLMNICADLRMDLIKNISSLPFITSDHPVVKYNQLFMSHSYYRPYAYGQMGIQSLFPISSSLCLVLFDPIPYRLHYYYGNKFIINDPIIIRSINRLIAGYANQEIYFSPTTSDQTVNKILSQRKPNALSPASQHYRMGNGFLFVNSEPSYLKKIYLPLFSVKKPFQEMKLSPFSPPLRPHAKKCLENDRCV